MLDQLSAQAHDAVARAVQLTYLGGMSIGMVLVGAVAAAVAIWGHDTGRAVSAGQRSSTA
jgi:hypothetical protein